MLPVMHPADPPLDPTGEQGRRLLGDELAKLPYLEKKSLIDTVLGWLTERLEGVAGEGAGPLATVILVLAVLALLAAIVYATTRIRSSRRVRRGADEADAVFDDADLSAAEYRQRAREAESRNEHSAALLDWFRAIIRSGDERALLGDSPGRTAHEFVRVLSPRFPHEREALRQAATVFDEVRYGGRKVGAGHSTTVRELDGRISQARPVHGDDDDEIQLVAPGRWAP
ncbi:DUF4129 domain-containing protein [Demetria terragena]|uniref:DUF4129 domain-containing protein n=1 Tax=Demetria terragena TaxID=63959 RepID=UPI000374518D|nr:DUF4129 domain-containing protein [Demetria terragena]